MTLADPTANPLVRCLRGRGLSRALFIPAGVVHPLVCSGDGALDTGGPAIAWPSSGGRACSFARRGHAVISRKEPEPDARICSRARRTDELSVNVGSLPHSGPTSGVRALTGC